MSKVVSLAAKRAAIEIIENQAVKTAGSLALKEVSSDIAKNYTKKEGFKLVVIEGTKNNPTKVAQVFDISKATSTQKKQLSNKISEIFEQKILGAKMTTWQNVVDAIIPLWTIAGAVTVINLAINGEMKQLFEEVAHEALVAMGWITGTSVVTGTQKNPTGFEKPSTGSVTDFDGNIVVDGYQNTLPPLKDIAIQTEGNFGDKATDLISGMVLNAVPTSTMLNEGSVVIWDFKANFENEFFSWGDTTSGTTTRTWPFRNVNGNKWLGIWSQGVGTSNSMYYTAFGAIGGGITFGVASNLFTNEHVTYSKNGEVTVSGRSLTSIEVYDVFPFNYVKRLVLEPLKRVGTTVSTVVTMITFKGDVYTIEAKKELEAGDVFSYPVSRIGLTMSELIDSTIHEPTYRITMASDSSLITVKPYIPVQEDINYININDFVMKPPTQIPLTTPSGEPLTITETETGELIYTTPNGQPVPETDIVISPETDIALQPNGEPITNPYPESTPSTPADDKATDWSWWNWLKELLNEIWKLIKDIASWLNPFAETFFLWVALVPSENYWTDYWNELAEGFNSKIPFFHQIYDFFGEIKDVSIGAKKPEFWVHIPEKFGGNSYNILDLTWYDQYRDYILMFMRFIMWFFFLKGMLRRLPKMVGD